MTSTLRRTGLGLVAVPVLLLAAACGNDDPNSFSASSSTIPADKVAGQLTQGMTEKFTSGFSDVACTGDIEDEVDATTSCSVTYQGAMYTIPARVSESTETVTTIEFDYSAIPAPSK